MSYGLGIDLGTTFTAAAIHRGGRVEMATLGDHTAAIPSVVLVREDGGVLVGDAADRRAPSEPERIAREVKRRLGDTTPLILGGSPHSVPSVMARQLRWVVDAVSEREGGRPGRIVLTHPANWGPYKRELFASVPALAEVGRVTMLREPEAAAVHYAANERVEPGSLVAVYDLGGGTFDATVLRKTERGFEILGTPEGIEGLGGIDFDEAVYAHVDRSLDGRLSEVDLDDDAVASALVRLRRECVLAKEALSSDTETTIPVLVPGLPSEVRLTRAEMEEMIRPAIDSTVASLRRALASARVGAGDLSTVLLVGGSSRIPLVSQVLSAELGRPTAVDTHPKHAVALGAAGLADTGRSGAPSGGFAPVGTPSGGFAPAGPTSTFALPRTGPPSRPVPRSPASGLVPVASGPPPTSGGTPRPAFGAGDAPPSLSGRGSGPASGPDDASSPHRRHLVPVLIAAAVLAIGAIVGGTFAFGSSSPSGQATVPPAPAAASVTPTADAGVAPVDGGGSSGGGSSSGTGSGGGGSSGGSSGGGGGGSSHTTTHTTTTTTTKPTTTTPSSSSGGGTSGTSGTGGTGGGSTP